MRNLSDRFAERIKGYVSLVDDEFDTGDLNRSVWLPYYLPQWAGRDASRARYRLRDECLELFISPDQEPWLPDVEGDLRVSSLQTGCFAGPVGSTIGQHRTNDELRGERTITADVAPSDGCGLCTCSRVSERRQTEEAPCSCGPADMWWRGPRSTGLSARS